MASYNHSSDEKHLVVNPKNLRFTQPDIKSTFKDATYPSVRNTASLLRRCQLTSNAFGSDALGEFHVSTDKEGITWCDNNRRLFALREAGVDSVPVKFDGNRCPQQAVKSKLKDPAFMPKIRGEASGVQIPSPPTSAQKVYQETKKAAVISVPAKLDGNRQPQKAVKSKAKIGGGQASAAKH